MNTQEKIQQAQDWLAQNNYDSNQFVFLNSNSPHGVKAEGKRLEEVLAEYAEAFNPKEKYTFVPNKGASRTESPDSDLIIDRNGRRKSKFNL